LASPQANATTQFLASQNPALVKRNVLASLTNVLLLPVTIVPKTVGAVGGALVTGGTAAVQGIAMLNPQRWVGGNSSIAVGSDIPYSRNLVGTINKMETEDEEDVERPSTLTQDRTLRLLWAELISSSDIILETPQHPHVADTTHQLDLLLSLDVALELIHADREALKRIETFAAYPGHYGHQVQDTIEEIFVLMIEALGDRHISPAFAQ
jgi:recyclin-1